MLAIIKSGTMNRMGNIVIAQYCSMVGVAELQQWGTGIVLDVEDLPYRERPWHLELCGSGVLAFECLLAIVEQSHTFEMHMFEMYTYTKILA